MKRILKISFILLAVGTTLFFTNHFLNEKISSFFIPKKEIQHNRPNNGYYKEYYETGSLKSEEYYNEGNKDGTWKTYYPNGKIQSIKTYNNNLLEGLTAHYDSCDVLVFTELFEHGVCKKREVVNDSLYKFKIRILPHGQEVFEKNCATCHDRKISLSLSTDSVKTSDLTFISMDSNHVSLFQKVFLDSLEKTKLYNDTTPLNDYDIQSLQYFLENLSTKMQKQPKNPKTLKIKGKAS